MAPSPQGTGECVLTFTNGWARGHCEYKNRKQEADQTLLTITKALTKTTNCTFKAKNVKGHDQVPPHFQIRSGATGHWLSSPVNLAII